METENKKPKFELWDCVEAMEMGEFALEKAHTVIEEALTSFQHPFTFDGSKEDEQRQKALINRSAVIESFLNIALDYIVEVQNSLRNARENVVFS